MHFIADFFAGIVLFFTLLALIVYTILHSVGGIIILIGMSYFIGRNCK